MDQCHRDAIDAVKPAFIEFTRDGTREFGFIAVNGWMASSATSMASPNASTALTATPLGHDPTVAAALALRAK